jgi:dihydroorotase
VRIFSDDGKCVFDPLVMRRALEYVKIFGGVIAQHAQEPRLTVDAQMNEGLISSQLGLKGWPAIAEEAIIARDILLAEHVGSRLHICHLTTAGGVDLVRWAKSRGVNVTAEVTPHHLLLTDDEVIGYDPIFKVNPPLRTQSDVDALRAGLADGTIDIVATDHAPHPAEDKDCEWQAAAFGMLGLETALSIVVKTMIETKLLTWTQLVERMSIRPAEIAGYSEQGQELSVGSVGNLIVVDPSASRTVDRNKMSSKSRNTPYHGMVLPAVVTHTFYKGKLVLSPEGVQH